MNSLPNPWNYPTYAEWNKEAQKIISNHIIPSLANRVDFFNILKNGQNLIIKAEASWCKPCKKCTPLIYELLMNSPSNVKMMVLDIDKHRDLASYFKINKVPTFISYKGKDRMDYSVGADENTIRSFFHKVSLYDGEHKKFPTNKNYWN